MISVIVPVYNVEDYLNECVESIVSQTYRDLEIILVDDGSTDSSGVICDEWRQKDSRIVVVHKENQGLSCARNTGLAYSNGDYIAFVDSDDYILKEMYQEMIECSQKYGADIVSCNHLLEKGGDISKSDSFSNKIICYTSEAFLDEYFLKLTKTNITPEVWQRLYKRKCIINSQFPEGRVYEDLVWTPQTFNNANKIVYIDKGLYVYRIRENSITFSNKYVDKMYFNLVHSAIPQTNDLCEWLMNNKYDKYIEAAQIVLDDLFLQIYLELIRNKKKIEYKDEYEYVSKRLKTRKWKQFYWGIKHRIKGRIILGISLRMWSFIKIRDNA